MQTDWKKGKVTTLIIPSAKYDPIVKMTVKVLGVQGIHEDLEHAKAASRYQEREELLATLQKQGAFMWSLSQKEEDDGSMLGEALDEEESDWGESVSGWLETASGDSNAEGDDHGRGPTPGSRRRTNRTSKDSIPPNTECEAPCCHGECTNPMSPHRKRRKAQENAATQGTKKQEKDDHILTINLIPPGVHQISHQAGLKAYHYMGDLWELDSDGLIVFTDTNLKIYNSKF